MEHGFQVNFLIVGTQKGGTSALAHFLAQHPEVCFTSSRPDNSPERPEGAGLAVAREAHFFDDPSFDDSLDAGELARLYQRFFPGYRGQHLVGEATPIYMYLPRVIRRIHRYNPKMRLIVLLRDPVERALSHYSMERLRGNESLSLQEALALEGERLQRDADNCSPTSSLRLHSYLDRGMYGRQLKEIFSYFPRDRVFCLRSDELLNRHEITVQKVYRFLGVRDHDFMPPHEIVFPTRKRVSLPAEQAVAVRKKFLPDLLLLEDLLGWGLSEWRDPARGRKGAVIT